MNEIFTEKFSRMNISAYELAAKAGLPYTTISHLIHQKTAINKISAEAVSRIALILGTTIDEILDPYELMDGVRGSCGKIKYACKYKAGEGIWLSYTIANSEYIHNLGKNLSKKELREAYAKLPELYITYDLKKQKENEKLLKLSEEGKKKNEQKLLAHA